MSTTRLEISQGGEQMKHKNIISLTACLFAVFFIIIGMFCIQPAAYAAEEIKIGAIFPLSGSQSPLGIETTRGLEIGVKELNREGGIKSLGGAKIKLVFADSRGDPKIGMSEAERLILKDKVVAILGAMSSGVTIPSSQVAERYKVPYLATIAVADTVTERGLKYVFRANENATLSAKELLSFLSGMGKLTGVPVKTLGFLYENTEWGQSSAKAWHRFAKEYGFDVIIDEPYPASTTDITPVIIKFKQKNPDAVVNASYVSDMILIVKTIAEHKWMPKAWISGGGGELESEFIKAVGNLADYYCTYLPFPPDVLMSEKYAWARKTADEFKKDYKAEFGCYAGEAYGISYVLYDAIERAGSIDPEKIRDSLTKTNITEESAKANIMHRRALMLPYARITFGPDGQNPHVRIPIGQFQNREIRTVYPPDLAAAGIKAIWPAPSWEKRN
jgi:branched-chain amino acid transport system substrate-binding protein